MAMVKVLDMVKDEWLKGYRLVLRYEASRFTVRQWKSCAFIAGSSALVAAVSPCQFLIKFDSNETQ